jgi:hypothetical protein
MLRILPPVGIECRAGLGGDGEARWHRQANTRHFGEIGAFAAEQVAHNGAAFILRAGKVVHSLLVATDIEYHSTFCQQ